MMNKTSTTVAILLLASVAVVIGGLIAVPVMETAEASHKTYHTCKEFYKNQGLKGEDIKRLCKPIIDI